MSDTQEKKQMKISESAILTAIMQDAPAQIQYEIKPPEFPPAFQRSINALRESRRSSGLAMDEMPGDMYSWMVSAQATAGGVTGFAGYPRLAMLSQYSEYRAPVETTATEMTREWIEIVTRGDDDLQNKVAALEAALKDFKVQKKLSQIVEHDGFFGRGQIFVDLGVDDVKQPLVINKNTIRKGSLKGFVNVEPMWTYPIEYNSTQPMRSDFYVPKLWAVMDETIHASRLLTLVGRPVPDMLKPAYNFGGMSLVQLIEPYVNRWLEGSQSIPQLMKSFSTSGIKTNLDQVLQGGGGEDLKKRAQLFNLYRDNRNLLVIDKETEEFFQFNSPLSGLDHLWSMLQEHMAAPAHIPLVILTGITPSGLNASSEGEIRVWYDYVAAQQPKMLGPILDKIFDILQLHLFGEIDSNISYKWNALKQMDDAQLADIRNKNMQTDTGYINANVLGPEEPRRRLANDPDSGYSSIDVDDLPEVPEVDEGSPQNPDGDEQAMDAALDQQLPDGVSMKQFLAGFKEEQEHYESVNGNEHEIAAIVIDHLKKDPLYYDDVAIGMDNGIFREEDHNRDDSGKFSVTSGGGKSSNQEVGGKTSSLKIDHFGPENKFTSVPVKFIAKENSKMEFSINSDGQAILMGPPIWLRNKDELNRTQLFRAVQNYLSPLPDDVFVRVSNNPKDYDYLKNGKHTGSVNHREGEKEYGLSVSKNPEYAADFAYYVKGKKIADGSDGEPIIDHKTATVIGAKRSYKSLVSDFNKKQEKHAQKLGINKDELRALLSSKRLVFE